jgi:hypothetical protein
MCVCVCVIICTNSSTESNIPRCMLAVDTTPCFVGILCFRNKLLLNCYIIHVHHYHVL